MNEFPKNLCDKDRIIIGEWAWKKAKESFYFEEDIEYWKSWYKLPKTEIKKELKKLPSEPPDGNIMYLNIAICCFGKKEIWMRIIKGK